MRHDVAAKAASLNKKNKKTRILQSKIAFLNECIGREAPNNELSRGHLATAQTFIQISKNLLFRQPLFKGGQVIITSEEIMDEIFCVEGTTNR